MRIIFHLAYVPQIKLHFKIMTSGFQIAVDIDCWADKTVGNEVVTYNFN